MASYPDGTIINGGTITAVDANPTVAGKGCIFTNVTFVNPTRFGEGCIFVECVFLDYNSTYNTQPHRAGAANVFTDCTFNYMIFGSDNIVQPQPKNGYRPNQGSPYSTYTESKTPALKTSYCPTCGAVVFTSNGVALVDESMYPKEEHKGGNVESSGLCTKCSGQSSPPDNPA